MACPVCNNVAVKTQRYVMLSMDRVLVLPAGQDHSVSIVRMFRQEADTILTDAVPTEDSGRVRASNIVIIIIKSSVLKFHPH